MLNTGKIIRGRKGWCLQFFQNQNYKILYNPSLRRALLHLVLGTVLQHNDHFCS